MAAGIGKKRSNGAEQDDVVLKALKRAHRPLSAYAIIAVVRDRLSLAPPTVYRTLERLIDAGHVHKLESLNAFVACTHEPHDDGPAFAICDDCGSVTEISLPKVDRSLEQWSRSKKFALSAAVVELHGTCQDCRAIGKQG